MIYIIKYEHSNGKTTNGAYYFTELQDAVDYLYDFNYRNCSDVEHRYVSANDSNKYAIIVAFKKYVTFANSYFKNNH